MNLGTISQIFLNAADTVEKPMAERLGFAGVNTLLGMGTVFLVLIFMSFVISCMKYIPKLLGEKDRSAAMVPEETVPVLHLQEEEEEIEPSDDYELVAVITAAIHASMGNEVPADGLVVKSIRRINNKKWQNAQ